jgi:hypothetical protein
MVIIGADLEHGFRDPGRSPTQADLEAVIGPATSVVVRSVGSKDVLYETQDASDLVSLRDALRVEGEMGHCMCLGSVAFEFDRDGKRLETVTLHHGESLRWDPFFYNAPLVESDPILDWPSARGVPEVREEYDDNRRVEAADAAAEERWHTAMPPALEPLWPSMLEPTSLEWLEVSDLMAHVYPDDVERARILFEWFGRGEGPWSGFASYEEVPESCLLQLPLDVLVEAARGEPQTESLREGAARLFAGWDFGQQRPDDLQQLPADLKLILLEHALKSPDDDKCARARRAFGASHAD